MSDFLEKLKKKRRFGFTETAFCIYELVKFA